MKEKLQYIQKQIKRNRSILLLLAIILTAIFIRTYNIHTLSVFIADQAIMSTETLQILRGDFTLLGPRASIAPLFFGPIVFYLMTPYYLLFQGYPLAGTVFQTSLQILSVPLVFLIGKRVKNEQVGLLAAFLFAISPLFVEYSRGSFNTTTALSFSTLIIVLFFSLLKNYRSWKMLVVGILLGCTLQMNFITVSLPLAIATFPLLFFRKLVSIKYYSLLILGFIIGFSPYIIFELRHNFFNTTAMLTYLFGDGGGNKSLMWLLTDIPRISTKILYGVDSLWLGMATMLLIMLGTVFMIIKSRSNVYFTFLLFLIANGLFISLIYGKHLESIYLIVLHTSFVVLIAAVVLFIVKKPAFIVLFVLLMLVVNAPQWNIHKPMHPLQDGLLMNDFENAAFLIKRDNPPAHINVAMDAQRDNRAMPLRYFLLLHNVPVLGYEDYGNAEFLYFIVRKTKNLQNITVWEYRAFGSSEVAALWDVNDQYIMYKLKKSP